MDREQRLRKWSEQKSCRLIPCYRIIEYIPQILVCSDNPTKRSARRQMNHHKFCFVQFSKNTPIFVSEFF